MLTNTTTKTSKLLLRRQWNHHSRRLPGVASSSIRIQPQLPFSKCPFATLASLNHPMTPPTQEQQQQQDKNHNNIHPIPSPFQSSSSSSPSSSSCYNHLTTTQLARSYVTLSLCQFPGLVRHAESILKVSRTYLPGPTITDWALQQTLFGQFCGGQNVQDLQPTMERLRKLGIGTILDYAAEDDGSSQAAAATANTTNAAATVEQRCDDHLERFLQCIRDAGGTAASELQQQQQNVPDAIPHSYVAIKVTALTDPKLLEYISLAIENTRSFFAEVDPQGTGRLPEAAFVERLQAFFADHDDVAGKQQQQQQHQLALQKAHVESDGSIDYIQWSSLLDLNELPLRAKPSGLNDTDDESIAAAERKWWARGHRLAQAAVEHSDNSNIRLLIDAEQQRFQPAIDRFVRELQRAYNSTSSESSSASAPFIYQTYQCYLKATPAQLARDLSESRRLQYHLGVKLVRGAYLESEQALAVAEGRPSPIHDSLEDTHACYDTAVETLLQEKAAASHGASQHHRNIEIMLATHNQASIEKAIAAMHRLGLTPPQQNSPIVTFSQLLGMADHLTIPLAQSQQLGSGAGESNALYQVAKYVPYGEIATVMPYLIRRANENSSVASGAAIDRDAIGTELWKRAKQALG